MWYVLGSTRLGASGEVLGQVKAFVSAVARHTYKTMSCQLSSISLPHCVVEKLVGVGCEHVPKNFAL